MEMKKRIRLTQAELDVILHMAGIANAGNGEGDYAPWSNENWAALNTLTWKVAELLKRKREEASGAIRGKYASVPTSSEQFIAGKADE